MPGRPGRSLRRRKCALEAHSRLATRTSNRTCPNGQFTLRKKFDILSVREAPIRLEIKDLMGIREQNSSSSGLVLYDSFPVRTAIAFYFTSPAAQRCSKECFPTSGVRWLRLFLRDSTPEQSKYPDWPSVSAARSMPFVGIHQMSPAPTMGN